MIIFKSEKDYFYFQKREKKIYRTEERDIRGIMTLKHCHLSDTLASVLLHTGFLM